MFDTIALCLLSLWLFGVASSMFIGGFIHVLALLAVAMVAIRLFTEPRGPSAC